MLETIAPTTRRRSSRISAAEVNTQSEPVVGERTNEDTEMQDTEMLPPTATLNVDRDTVKQDTEVLSESTQPPVIGTNWKPRQAFSVSHTIERAILALHREHEVEDEETTSPRSDNDSENSSNSNDHDSNSGGSFNSEDMDKRALSIASVVQTKETSTTVHEEHSSSESDEDEDSQTDEKNKRKQRGRERERERGNERSSGMDKDAHANPNENVDVNEIPATMPVPPPRSLTSTTPLPGSDLLQSLNVPDYHVTISPPTPTRSSSYTPPAPVLSLIPTTAPPPGFEVPDVKYGTYRCAGTYRYRELVTIGGTEQYGGPMLSVNCGIEFQIKLGTRRDEMGYLVNAEPFRCKACRCRMLYKVRTNRMIQFEAR